MQPPSLSYLHAGFGSPLVIGKSYVLATTEALPGVPEGFAVGCSGNFHDRRSDLRAANPIPQLYVPIQFS
jgi:hypothetical protein